MKRCPKCGGMDFAAKIVYAGIVEIDGDVKRIKQQSNEYQVKILRCMNKDCEKAAGITEEELINSKKCARCGQEFFASEIAEDGICLACHAIETNDFLRNATKEQLISMMLKLQTQVGTSGGVTNKTTASVDAKKKAVEAVVQKAKQANEDEAVSTPSEAPEQPVAAPKPAVAETPTSAAKPPRKRVVKSAVAKNAEPAAEAAAQPEIPVNAQPQEPAPVVMPEQRMAPPTPPINPPVPPEGQPFSQAPGGFQMFDTPAPGNSGLNPF